MSLTTRFTIGAEARCSDGAAGKVTRVVIDPLAETVTHLVVQPAHRHAAGRLVPLGLVRSTDGEVRLSCTVAEFEALDLAEETHFLPAERDYSDYGAGQALVWPFYELTIGGPALAGAGRWAGDPNLGMGTGFAEPVTTDTVPDGEVAVHRGDPVHASDGEIGQVRGLVVDSASHHVTHVLLHEGHLFGRKEVAIPIGSVTRIGNSIRLDLTKRQVEDLPPQTTTA